MMFCHSQDCVVGFNAMFAWIYSTFVDAALRDLRAAVFELAGMKPGSRVLDVCCGTGEQVLHFAGKGVHAAGVDVDPRMIAMAERNRRKAGVHIASFQVADACRLPFPNGCFDCATVSLALHDKERATRDGIISEMKRVLKSDGVLVFADFTVPLPRNHYGVLIRVVEFLAGRDHFRCSRDYLGQGGLDVLFERNGLREDSRRCIKHGTMTVARAAGPR
jgi:ubiquinone/menaquinone biosynthesis C-methylase UbiE